jgi:DNA polymerase-3 subunit epsilon
MAARIGVTFKHHHAEEDAAACAKVALAAARDQDTSRISLLAERLALAPRVLRAPVAAPPSPARRRGEQPTVSRSGPLVFHVQGSTGSRYEISCDHAGQTYHLRCTCMAGLNRRRCKHVTALLDGEVEHLVSDNLYDLAKLKVIVEAVGAHAVRPASRAG